MRIDLEKLLFLEFENCDSCEDLFRSISVYRKGHGHDPVIYSEDIQLLTDEESNILTLNKRHDQTNNALMEIHDLFVFEPSQWKRYRFCVRFMRKWYTKTKWQKCASESLLTKIENYITA